jgi:dolichol-phosphate mannosyltransferase
MKLAVVVAAYDESENIEILTRRLARVLQERLREGDAEMIFVVEGRDGTREILEKLSAELGGIRILYRELPSGLGDAFRRGFAAVPLDADYVITLDADLNHAPEEIPRLLDEAVQRDLDVLIGSRFIRSSVTEGIPVWKWWLSILMNRLIGSLFDVEARDKTSGFRIYRAAALRSLTDYRNRDFAFLPEILIRANELGMKVGEAPIHFRFRTRGQSKMSIVPTSRSYLALLRTRFDRWSVAALAILMAGVLLRLLYAFPVHKYVADADAVLAPLRAFDILAGDMRVFYSYTRIGALESYIHAVAFLLVGPTRAAIAIAPLLSGILALFAFFFFVRELFGREAACFALLFFAIPSPAYIAWSYMPNGYPETLLFCVAVLYFAARMARTGYRPLETLCLGLAAGLGFWNSIQSLMCTVPAAVWLLLHRPKLIRTPLFFLLGLAGFGIGAAPWVAYNVVHPLAALRGNFTTRAAGPNEILSNAGYLVGTNVPELTIGTDPLGDGKPDRRIQEILRPPAAAIYFSAGFLLLALPFLSRVSDSRAARLRRSSALLLWLIVAAVVFFFSVSAAGGLRVLTVRYALPLYIVIATVLGLLVWLLWTWRRIAGVAVAVILLAFHVSSYYLPGTRFRTYLGELARFDAELVAALQKRGVRWVCGNYWVVYPLNFLSRQRILGVPFDPLTDHYDYARALPSQPEKVALVGRDPTFLKSWAARTGLPGSEVAVGEGFHIFLPTAGSTSTPRELLKLFQETAPAGH